MNPLDNRGEDGRDSRSRTDLTGDFLGGEGDGDGDLAGFLFSLGSPWVSILFFRGDLFLDLLNKLGNIEESPRRVVLAGGKAYM